MKHMQKRKSVHFSAPAWLWLCFCIGAAVIFSGVLLCSWSSRTRAEISQGVLRLHILANSDTDMDQQLKLQVRDRILQDYGSLFRDCQNAESAAKRARTTAVRISKTAERELRRRGSLYPVTVQVEKAAFPTKCYGGVRLPAGSYLAVNVRIGAAAGHNWWCVLYPPLCLTDGTVKADADTLAVLRRELSAEEYALITQTETINVKMKFRILEILFHKESR